MLPLKRDFKLSIIGWTFLGSVQTASNKLTHNPSPISIKGENHVEQKTRIGNQ
jgi:hypothetical protein